MLEPLILAVVAAALFGIAWRVATDLGASGAGPAVAGALAVMGLFALGAWRQRARTKSHCPEGQGVYPECQYRVSVGDRGITVQSPSGESITLPIADLKEIAVVTNDSGPTSADVWWHLTTGPAGTASLAYPGGATGEQQALAYFNASLPGFDDEMVIQAMGCTSNRRFVCWRAAA